MSQRIWCARGLAAALALGAGGCALLLDVDEGKPLPLEGSGGGGGTGGGGGAGTGGEGPEPAPPDAPRVLFTDISSGPKTGGENGDGAFVTLYGVRLVEGSSTPTVTFGGQPAPIKLAQDAGAARDLDVVVVQPGKDAPEGEVDVVVSRDGIRSDPVKFTVRSGAIYFADGEGGSDDSDGGLESPFASLEKLVASLKPGDIGYVRGGEYSAHVDCNPDAMPPVRCALPLVELPGNSSTARPFAVIGYPGEEARLGVASEDEAIFYQGITAYDAGHVVVANLTVSDIDVGVTVRWTQSFRVVGCHFERFAPEAVYAENDTSVLKVLGSTFSGGDMSGWRAVAGDSAGLNLEVGYSVFDTIGYSVSVPMSTTVLAEIHDNLIREGGTGVSVEGCEAAGGCSLRGKAFVFNNVISEMGRGVLLPSADPAGAEVFLFNNTFYDTDECAVARATPAVADPMPALDSVHFENNIVVPIIAPYLCLEQEGGPPLASDLGFKGGNNLWYRGAGEVREDLGAQMDPLFVDPPFDLRPEEGSPALDSGAGALGGGNVPLPASLRFDHAGLPRVMGGGIDIGAYERVSD